MASIRTKQLLQSPVGWVYLKLVAIVGAICTVVVFSAIGWVVGALGYEIVIAPVRWIGTGVWNWHPGSLCFQWPWLAVEALWILILVSFVAWTERRKQSTYHAIRSLVSRSEAATIPERAEPIGTRRKIVLCIDGTNNFATDHPTHVYRLYACLKDSPDVVAYYDGGVGALGDTTRLSDFGRQFATLWDLAFGLSIQRNVSSAYAFLMEHYRGPELDEVILFGFSRGAFACRVLCGLLQVFGLLPKENDNLIPFLWQSYCQLHSSWDAENVEIMRKSMRLQRVPISYLGLWDTVSSIGLLRQRTFPYTSSLLNVEKGRHAVSIDERRNMFPESPTHAANVDEQWFAGVHTDVGGGNPKTSALSFHAYRWVLEPVQDLVGDLDGGEFPGIKPLDPDPMKSAPPGELTAVLEYALAGFVPQRIFTYRADGSGDYRWHWFRLWHTRYPMQAKIHPSVKDLMEGTAFAYLPRNLMASRTELRNGNVWA